MTSIISALVARTQLGQTMKRAREKQARFIVDRRGEPQVVIMGVQDFVRTMAPEPEILKAIRAGSKRKGTNKLTMREIDQEIAAYRRGRRARNAEAKDRA
ncbi:MAG TPA: type II toxin-antitoxin system Phd/YefM family antitoxin [Terriglobia bacterium]|nr:type II toxin-antitoxin system Phd/YefM family antitoxin [Terriglobia bacterium]